MASIEWMSEAVCAQVDTDLFFPEQGGNPAQAIAVCRRCPVQQKCLDHVLELDRSTPGQVTGIWGGTTAKQRQALRGAAYRPLAS